MRPSACHASIVFVLLPRAEQEALDLFSVDAVGRRDRCTLRPTLDLLHAHRVFGGWPADLHFQLRRGPGLRFDPATLAKLGERGGRGLEQALGAYSD